MKVLVTGANGFVGKLLCAELLHRGLSVRAALRETRAVEDNIEIAVVGNIDSGTNWEKALIGVDVVVHLAARVHVMNDTATDPLAEFRQVNVLGTLRLAQQAVQSGVKRLVYVSSIKVNGEETTGQRVYTELDRPEPKDPYGISKWEAEQTLQRISKETGIEVVIVRPPLVYGPGVKGNFVSLLAAVSKGIPLPLAGARNARSLVYVGNLTSALIACASHPVAAGRTYLVSDGEDVSTADLVRKIAVALGCNSRLVHIPPSLLRGAAALLGRTAQIDRLFGSLRVDAGKLHTELDWTPPYTMDQGLKITADWYLDKSAIQLGRPQ